MHMHMHMHTCAYRVPFAGAGTGPYRYGTHAPSITQHTPVHESQLPCNVLGGHVPDGLVRRGDTVVVVCVNMQAWRKRAVGGYKELIVLGAC